MHIIIHTAGQVNNEIVECYECSQDFNIVWMQRWTCRKIIGQRLYAIELLTICTWNLHLGVSLLRR